LKRVVFILSSSIHSRMDALLSPRAEARLLARADNNYRKYTPSRPIPPIFYLINPSPSQVNHHTVTPLPRAFASPLSSSSPCPLPYTSFKQSTTVYSIEGVLVPLSRRTKMARGQQSRTNILDSRVTGGSLPRLFLVGYWRLLDGPGGTGRPRMF
jgi:hypothetical protein